MLQLLTGSVFYSSIKIPLFPGSKSIKILFDIHLKAFDFFENLTTISASLPTEMSCLILCNEDCQVFFVLQARWAILGSTAVIRQLVPAVMQTSSFSAAQRHFESTGKTESQGSTKAEISDCSYTIFRCFPQQKVRPSKVLF